MILVGHLGKDPEVRHLDAGVTVASFPLATSENYTKDGRKIEQTEWHQIVMWRGLADVAAKYLKKGKLVYIEGKLRTRNFEDKEGQKRYSTEVVAESFTMLGKKEESDGLNNHSVAPSVEKQQDGVDLSSEDEDDGLPF